MTTVGTSTHDAPGVRVAGPSDRPVLRHTLGVLSASAVDRSGNSLDAAVSEQTKSLPALPGFVESTFSPLTYEASRRCLSANPADGRQTAVVVASLMGDTTTADLASQRLIAGRVHNPLLFMQATTNSVMGYISQEFAITGQMVSISTLDDPVVELLTMADVLLDDADVGRVLVVAVELAGTERVAAAYRELAGDTGRPALPAASDAAVALLLERVDPGSAGERPAVSLQSATIGGAADGALAIRGAGQRGTVQGLRDIASAYHQLRRDGGTRVLISAASSGGAPTFILTATTHGQCQGD